MMNIDINETLELIFYEIKTVVLNIFSIFDMKKNSNEIGLDFPDLFVTVSTDWTAIFSMIVAMIVTAFVVVMTNKSTNKNFQKTISSQERIAEKKDDLENRKIRVETESKNRQAWINILRDDVSKIVEALIRQQTIIDGSVDHTAVIEGFIHNKKISQEVGNLKILEIHAENANLLELVLSDIQYLYTKIKLMLNLKEEESEFLIEAIAVAMKETKDESSIISKIPPIEKAAGIILKKEWDRVKSLK
ncbi:hypothetical protein [Aliamphritea ceti]|uniref:hypothetical protein n=1 Tax=Aliamphritea ceti TaxID=1524258 RepID=UPI0021C35F42|nr:hypothetical protein [Aliamphritea ceti]